jgi:predicted small lipoprotein YifL
MILRTLMALALAFAVSACGTKTNLTTPAGQKTTKGQLDPSLPPNPINK